MTIRFAPQRALMERLSRPAPAREPVTEDTPGAFFCHECGAWLLHGGIVHDEGEHESRRR